jgi:hypothetical protein
METFQEKFCTRYGVPAARYGETVLRLTLYPHARWLRLVPADELLAADRRFVAAVGRLTRWRSYSETERDYQHDPQNRLFSRSVLRLRISGTRMRLLFSEVWGQSIPAEPESPGGSRAAEGRPGLSAD